MKLINKNEIVLVDDDEIDTQFIERCLKLSTLTNNMVSFTNGAEFLDYMEMVFEQEAPMPAIILLDINMPGMDGFETVAKLREYDVFKNQPPLLFLTTSDSGKDKSIAAALNVGFVEKFFSRTDAIQFLNSLE